jgi:hypothetical protein
MECSCCCKDVKICGGRQEFDCAICGEHETNHYICHQKMQERKRCFHCNFWMELIEDDDFGWEGPERLRVVVDGKHYVAYVDEENLKPAEGGGVKAWARGFGGHGWHIKFNDGKEVVCYNVWHQGEIPARFRDRLPDNATFVRDTV